MSDLRDRPEYGEYASPEEQAAAMGLSAPILAPPTVVPEPLVIPPVGKQPRRWDMVLTIALVVVGAYVVFNSFSTYTNLAVNLHSIYGLPGSYPDVDRANGVGLTLNIVQPILLVVAVLLSSWSLRRGRLSFYIPLAAGVIALTVSMVLLGPLLLADPAIVTFMEGLGLPS